MGKKKSISLYSIKYRKKRKKIEYDSIDKLIKDLQLIGRDVYLTKEEFEADIAGIVDRLRNIDECIETDEGMHMNFYYSKWDPSYDPDDIEEPRY